MPKKSKTSSDFPPHGAGALQLIDLLRALPKRELDSLIQRLRIRIDTQKRIDVPSQVARALLMLPEVRDPGQLPRATLELLYRIAEHHGVLHVESLPPAVEPLVLRGMVFARGLDEGVELLLPIAFMVQLRSWDGEDPRGVRALLSQSHPDVAASIAAHYLGRPATPPIALSLEQAWQVLTTPELLNKEVEELAPLERKLLHAVEEVGGEVDTEELLDLEREPMRLRGATGATPSRRGVGFALERRGFLVPVHPNRHVVPSEVARIIGAERHEERKAQREQIRAFVLDEDHAPRRARFAQDPVPLVMAMALAVRDPSIEVRPGVGTPRSLIGKFSSRFGRDHAAVAVLASLSRALGLWDGSVMSTTCPPGSLRVHELAEALFRTWRRGGAWDEAREDGELLRVTGEAREASAVGVLREMVLEALQELGDGRWAPWEAVAAYIRTDTRTPGLTRLIERWASRVGVEPLGPLEIARRVALESLHVLGVVDLGDPDDDDAAVAGPVLRITPRGRAFLQGVPNSAQHELSRFLDTHALRIGAAARVGQVVALAPFVDLGSVSGHLDVALTPQTLSLALSAGIDPELIKTRLEAVASLPDPIARQLVQASAVIGRAELVETQGFLWVEDPEIRELLRTRRQCADLFVDPSPPAGLLVAPGVDIDRLARRCRTLGVELLVEGEPYKARSVPPSRGSGARRLESSQSLQAVRQPSGTRKRRASSTGMPAVKRGENT
ncbi:MAG TPA: hypothetical protein VI197_35090 [Polyangiaceae bacterium]